MAPLRPEHKYFKRNILRRKVRGEIPFNMPVNNAAVEEMPELNMPENDENMPNEDDYDLIMPTNPTLNMECMPSTSKSSEDKDTESERIYENSQYSLEQMVAHFSNIFM